VRRLVVVGCAVVLAAACSSSSKSGSGNTSKTVTLLTHSSFAASKNVLADFTKQTGYTVKLVQPGDAGVMVNQAILNKDHPVADALYGVDNTFLTRALKAGIFEKYQPADLKLQPGVAIDPTHTVTPIDSGDVCLNYDKSYFGANGHPAPPTSLADLIEPRYKNLTVVENAGTSSPGLAFLLATIAAFGDNQWKSYWQQLRANGVRVVNDWTQAYEQDFTAGGGPGDRPIVVSYGSSPPADIVYSDPKRDTSRVGVVEDSCFRQTEYAGVLKGASNPKGAKAWVDFMASKEFQNDMPLQMYVYPTVVGTVLPDVFTTWAVIPKNPYTIPPKEIDAHRDEWIKEWTDIAVR
jgi:thiamine transport system substrate-binding protein